MKELLVNLLGSNTGALTLEDILLNFLVAVLLGIVIYCSYRFSHSSAVYSARFNVSLLMLTLTTTLVMNVIGNNIALSLGMVGALSIVRFRTAIKDPRDATYIFWGIAVGICCGVSEYLIAAIGTGVIFLLMLLFGSIKSNERYLLIVRGDREAEVAVERAVEQFYSGKALMKVKNTTGETVEMIYEISMKMMRLAERQNGAISRALHDLDGVGSVGLVSQNDEINR
ncbi:DUF4956 domain-containing protein [Oscillospiraceae bacterium OttesenSCG-928-F05]|nr:DUF4956 domain-containing protein [Oscillospiraceae bacterium OttesenSCG-928-F05]